MGRGRDTRERLVAMTKHGNVRDITAQLHEWRHVFPEVWGLWLEWLILNILDDSRPTTGPDDVTHIDQYAYLREILSDINARSNPRG